MLKTKHWVQLIPSCIFILLGLFALACSQTGQPSSKPWSVSSSNSATAQAVSPTYTGRLPIIQSSSTDPLPLWTPTPDAPHPLPTMRSQAEEYIVQPGDTLYKVAQANQVSMETIMMANDLANPNLLQVGQTLVIPAPDPDSMGSGSKIIPDSELVFGPGSVDFDLRAFINLQGGYLVSYEEMVDQRPMTGAEIVERIAQEYSLDPRLLLAVLEYQSGWVTLSKPAEETLEYPILVAEAWRKGLYLQLAWAANQLNQGYYLWRVGAVSHWILSDGKVVPVNPTINAGTAGVQNLFANLYGREAWDQVVSPEGFLAIYEAFFSYPFQRVVEPLLPPNLSQPVMQLPFETGLIWAFTGGPHGGWGDGSAWAALDFAPPGESLGCVRSDAWVVAVADGTILRAKDGAVIQDLDLSEDEPNDGLEQTGWVVLYMHIEGRDRVEPGTYLKAGDRIGHPSCEGGVSTGTHLHLARRYNGEWIPADQDIPFVLDGWVSIGAGRLYDGFLMRDGITVEAWEGYFPVNMIQR